MNREIKSANVRVINEEGQPLGVIPLEEAMAQAERAALDLVEVSANADPPVCKIMDYGKYRYKQSKKIHDARKSQTVIHVKEIRLRPKTEAHDLQVKIKHIKKFLEQRDKVKISMIFRGREIAFTEIGRKIMEQIKAALADECIMDQEPRLEGRSMVMIVSPKK
ncbi:MAG: translation initiation factor IF-3 [Smithellaceae bacterium]|nr:translation initiation factor IF-3 [Smithellaceae bacterium]MDD3259619.1 translation initiation factor IF-3 [Smithellaceae bacterium]MDD3849138.1 translation initiation factor IF-3 [Smithellaceae bacterium]HOG12104.1 translation initiation factor IF-3 [Smithellaceae bacterium]HPL09683.1 translation initiation factor IF-3 [Smithellaceae bacterium]